VPVVLDTCSALACAVDAVCEIDPGLLADGETIEVLHRQLARLEAAVTRAAAAFESGGVWETDGARSAAAWIATRCGLPKAAAQRRVRLGRQLRHLPGVEAGWLAGRLNVAHVERIAAACGPATADLFARGEQIMVESAVALTYRQFQRVVAYWEQQADPDGVELDADRQHQRRHLYLSQSIDGLWFLEGRLDPVGGAAVAAALGRIEREAFAADWAEARTRAGAELTVSGLARTPSQRRADALVEMARRAGAVPPGARLPEPLFSVFVGYETFAGRICELADGTVITPGTVARWLSEAWIERAVFDGPDRVINVGYRRRLFTGGARRGVEVRDRECYHEFCDLPADQCQIDHIQPYAAGGATTHDNGRVACGYHNRWRHRRTKPPP
jgi:hypothetical protein